MQVISEEAVGPNAAVIVRTARNRAGLTQRGAARRCGVTQSVFCDYERGARDPSLGTLRALIAPLGYDVALTLVRRVVDGDQLGGPIGSELLQHLDEVLAVFRRHRASRVWAVGRVVEGLEDPDYDGLRFHADLPDEKDVFALLTDVSELFGYRYPINVDIAYPLRTGGILLPKAPFVELTVDDDAPA